MIKIFEAFAGYGTATFALKQLKIEHELIGFSEIDKYAIHCFKQNHGSKNYGSITEINWNKVPDFDLLTGGFPCQDVSNAGKQDLSKGRSILGFELTKALKIKQPKYFMFENVKGILSKRFEPFLKELLRQWKEAGYVVQYKKLNTREHGIPQNRERVFFIGIRKDIKNSFTFPEPTELKLKLKDILEDNPNSKYFLGDKGVAFVTKEWNLKKRYTQINGNVALCQKANQQFNWHGDFILEEPKENVDEKYFLKAEQIKNIEKSNYQDRKPFSINGVSKTLNTAQGGGHTPLISQVVEVYDDYNSKVKEDSNVSCTLTQNCGAKAARNGQKLILDSKVRRLTPKECFRLQGFLDDRVNLEGLSDTQKYKLAGNGQSVNVVKLLFKELINELECEQKQ